ncbi:hypothetical protein K0F35_23365, partial [Bacteroides ovatus]|nr:hypothetical protein [Bacteroides ovatus]
MKVQKPMTNLKALSLMILLIAFVGHSNTQVETKIGMKQQIAKMEELIKQEFQMVKTYPEQPAYYVQEIG